MFERLVEISKALNKDETLRCKHVSFILHKGKVVSIGQNHFKTHPIHVRRNPKWNSNGVEYSDRKPHCSEWSVIKNFLKRTNIPIGKCTLVNIRLDSFEQIRSSYPCESCRSLLSAVTPKRVFYTDNDGQFLEMNF